MNRATARVFQYEFAREILAISNLGVRVHLVAETHQRFADGRRIPGKLRRLSTRQGPGREQAHSAEKQYRAAHQKRENSAISKHFEFGTNRHIDFPEFAGQTPSVTLANPPSILPC